MSGIIQINEDDDDYENATGDVIQNENAEDFEDVTGAIEGYEEAIAQREKFHMEVNESYVNHILALHPTFGKRRFKSIVVTFVVLTVLVAALILAFLITSIAFALRISELSGMAVNAQQKIQEPSASTQTEQGLRIVDIAERVASLETDIMNYSNPDELNNLPDGLKNLSSQIGELSSYFNEKFNSLSQRLDGLDKNSMIVNKTLTELQHVIQMQGKVPSSPVSSCAALLPSSPSGYYWVRTANCTAIRVYCDMTRSCGNITGGWMRVAKLDMTNSSHQCPSGLTEHMYSNSIKRTCVRSTSLEGCSSVVFPIEKVNYIHVCGKVIGYQYGTPEAFWSHYLGDDVDVDGVILSHGPQQQHIWTFAAARGETFQTRRQLCPCIRSDANFSGIQPSNVGDDYFCDTGSSGDGEANTFYGDDPLWDGAGCENTNTCCTFNTPPWFYKQLPQPTTDYIEMRVCRSAEREEEDIAIEMYEILVQ